MLVKTGNSIVNTSQITDAFFTPAVGEKESCLRMWFGSFDTGTEFYGKEAEALWKFLCAECEVEIHPETEESTATLEEAFGPIVEKELYNREERR